MGQKHRDKCKEWEKSLINVVFATTNNDILDIYPFSQKPYQAADSDFFLLFGRIRLANAKCLTKIFFLNAKPQKDLKMPKSSSKRQIWAVGVAQLSTPEVRGSHSAKLFLQNVFAAHCTE